MEDNIEPEFYPEPHDIHPEDGPCRPLTEAEEAFIEGSRAFCEKFDELFQE